eukprot:COSAG01_NODE_69006_length_262_cov_1.276074_1_plen_54_part_10
MLPTAAVRTTSPRNTIAQPQKVQEAQRAQEDTGAIIVLLLLTRGGGIKLWVPRC